MTNNASGTLIFSLKTRVESAAKRACDNEFGIGVRSRVLPPGFRPERRLSHAIRCHRNGWKSVVLRALKR